MECKKYIVSWALNSCKLKWLWYIKSILLYDHQVSRQEQMTSDCFYSSRKEQFGIALYRCIRCKLSFFSFFRVIFQSFVNWYLVTTMSKLSGLNINRNRSNQQASLLYQDLSSFNPILSENRTIVAEICSARIHEELNITPSTRLKVTCHTVEQGPFGRNPVV